ncbi:MAG: glutamate racemase [Bdellovibrionales bacterium]|nr:glutamate racemase [Bdellovibrionales bacterium]
MNYNVRNKLRIGVFDSGIGGLTVLHSLFQKAPQHHYFYLGDTARLPYGNKSPKTLKKYVDQNIRFLLTKNVDAIVVACNSASSVIENREKYPVPIFDVIGPSAVEAVKHSFAEKVAVIATSTTVKQKAYIKAIHNLSPSTNVIQQACPLLVPLVEEGWLDDPLTNLVLYRYLSPLLLTEFDTLILGCTHYPLLIPAIKKVIGKEVKIISSAESVADDLVNYFQQTTFENFQTQPEIELYMTDDNPILPRIFSLLFNKHYEPNPQIVVIS